MFQAAIDDPQVGRVILDIDSPGGQVDGIPETAARIREGRERKPVDAVVNTMAASAAYYLAAQATSIIGSESSVAGSIGVYAMHVDWSAANEREGVTPSYIEAPEGGYKTEGHPNAPLGDEARQHMQGIVNEFYGMFVRDVARGRGVSEGAVRNDYGKGRMFTAAEARKRGMIDRIGSLDDTLARLSGQGRATGNRAAAERARLALA